jgi:hypothetical protein
MSDLQDKKDDKKHDNVLEDILTTEEQLKIESIQIETFVKPEPSYLPFDISSIFGFNKNKGENLYAALGANQTQKNALFDFRRIITMEKFVIINNISGKNAYIILTPAPIKTVNSVGLGAGVSSINASINTGFENKGEYKIQKLSIANDTSSRYELDNNDFYCTLFLNIDEHWKKIWDNRLFNGRKYDINILERHTKAGLEKDNIPDF